MLVPPNWIAHNRGQLDIFATDGVMPAPVRVALLVIPGMIDHGNGYVELPGAATPSAALLDESGLAIEGEAAGGLSLPALDEAGAALLDEAGLNIEGE